MRVVLEELTFGCTNAIRSSSETSLTSHAISRVMAKEAACEIRIRAERKAGELLREMKENGQRQTGGGDQKSLSRAPTVILPDMGRGSHIA
jgi:hypothetical protein